MYDPSHSTMGKESDRRFFPKQVKLPRAFNDNQSSRTIVSGKTATFRPVT